MAISTTKDQNGPVAAFVLRCVPKDEQSSFAVLWRANGGRVLDWASAVSGGRTELAGGIQAKESKDGWQEAKEMKYEWKVPGTLFTDHPNPFQSREIQQWVKDSTFPWRIVYYGAFLEAGPHRCPSEMELKEHVLVPEAVACPFLGCVVRVPSDKLSTHIQCHTGEISLLRIDRFLVDETHTCRRTKRT